MQLRKRWKVGVAAVAVLRWPRRLDLLTMTARSAEGFASLPP